MSIVQDIVYLDKPVGVTSRGVLALLQKKLQTEKGIEGGEKHRVKMGHAGTLDPNASGLLVVGVGSGTKKLKEYVGLSKVYDAEMCIGERRSTGDREGEVIESATVPPLSKEELTEVLKSLEGVHRLPVPRFSAVKRGGQPLYKQARHGRGVGVLPLRDMEVFSAEYRAHECRDDTCTLNATLSVASGVYIRSLAEEVGKRLGYPATLWNLRRTHVGEVSVSDARVISLNDYLSD